MSAALGTLTIGHTYSHQQHLPLCVQPAPHFKALGMLAPSLALSWPSHWAAGCSLELNMLCSEGGVRTCLYDHLLTWQNPMGSSISDDTVVHLNTPSGSQGGKVVPAFLFYEFWKTLSAACLSCEALAVAPPSSQGFYPLWALNSVSYIH